MSSTAIVRKFNGPVKRVHQERPVIKKKWSGHKGAQRAYPEKQARLSEGVVNSLKETCNGHVCEVGCGTGRIAKFSEPGKYIGVDINKTALSIAKNKRPQHTFKPIEWDSEYPEADTYLFFTVMLHIPDQEISGIIERLKNRIVIVESMGRWKRDYGRDNNYHRDPRNFRDLFNDIGLREVLFYRCHDLRYPFEINLQVFE